MPPHTRKVLGTLLTQQLRRPKGVNGLLTIMFGDELEGDDPPLDKLMQVAKILTAIPAAVKPEVDCFPLPFLDSHSKTGVSSFSFTTTP